MKRLLASSIVFFSLLSGAHAKADDERAIQALLDTAAVQGGGTVNLPPGIYVVNRPLIVPSRVRLIGAGPGITIIRRGSLTGKTIGGADVYATISTVAAEHAMVADLTIDNRTFGMVTNGLSLLPDGAGYAGTPSKHCVVSRVEVAGVGSGHAYMIWSLRGQSIDIVDNFVDGGTPAPATESNEEGIEIYGGDSVRVTGNTVRSVGNACINVGSAGLADSATTNLHIVNNELDACGYGVHLGGSPENGGQGLASVDVDDNIITNSVRAGVFLYVLAGTTAHRIEIKDNTIDTVGTPLSTGFGIWLQGEPAAASDLSSFDVHLRDNDIWRTLGPNGCGITVARVPNVRAEDNEITEARHSGILAADAQNIELISNRINETAYFGIWLWGGDDNASVRENAITSWNGAGAGTAGILLQSSSVATVADNLFSLSTSPQPAAIFIDSTALTVSMTDNVVLYQPSGEPFINLSR